MGCTECWSAKCDEGTHKSQLLVDLPWLRTWKGIEELEEEWWPIERENEFDRVVRFLAFLCARPESKIVVVSHGGFLTHIIGHKLSNIERHVMTHEALQEIASAPIPVGRRLSSGSQCSLCLQVARDSSSGVVCSRRREDGSVGGCGKGVCWVCMKQASPMMFGKVRITRDEWNFLAINAWWMHEKCMTGS